MTPTRATSGLAFAGNPITIETSGFLQGGLLEEDGRFRVILDQQEIYRGRFEAGEVLDLSEIAASAVKPIRDAQGSDLVVEVEEKGEFLDRIMTVEGGYGGLSLECNLFVLPGGVSKRELRLSTTTGRDIFERRFLNHRGNFFLTTRTATNRLPILETELAPLYFVVGSAGIGEISVRDRLSGDFLSLGAFNAGIYALNIPAIRRTLFNEQGILSSVLDVHVAGRFACRIYVEEAPVARQRHLIKFRNSFGVYDYFETTGEISVQQEDVDGNSWSIPDSITGGFRDMRDRVEARETLKIKTGPVADHRIPLLADLLRSEEIWLLDYNPEPVRLIPTGENVEYKKDGSEPTSFELQFERAEADAYADNEYDNTNRPRIFSREFSGEFA